MYKLSEQPIESILQEMTDFEPLIDRIGIFRVKAKLLVKDMVYETGDHVAICGYRRDCIMLISYESFLHIPTSQMIRFGSGIDPNNTYEISVDDFKTNFEICSDETKEFEEIRKKALQLYDEKEINQSPYINPGDLLVICNFIFTIFGLFGALMNLGSVKCLAIIFYLIALAALVEIIIGLTKEHKWKKIEKEFYRKCYEIDEQRKLDGLFVEVQQR